MAVYKGFDDPSQAVGISQCERAGGLGDEKVESDGSREKDKRK
jgi:hypothetical protein